MPLTRDDLVAEAKLMKRRVDESYGSPERWVPQSNPASTCGHPCPYYLWAVRFRPNDLPEPWDGLPRIFQEGKESEIKVRRLLEDAGYEVSHEQVRFRDEQLDITGLIDGYVRRRGSEVCGQHVPYETKGFSANNFVQALSFESMLKANYWRIRLAPAQLLMYAFMAPEERPVVCFVSRNKSTGEIVPFFEFVDDWFHVLEGVCEVLTKVNMAIAAGAHPEPMLYNPVFCDKCDAVNICPRMMSLRGTGNISLHLSPDVDEICRVYCVNKPLGNKAEAAKRKIKNLLETLGTYDLDEEGQMNTIVTEEHRMTVTLKGGKKYLEVVPLEKADSAEGKEVEE